jgi:hypothetical protein
MKLEEHEHRMKTDPVYKEIYKVEVAKKVLEVIANCSDNSTLEGVKKLASECLKDLNS